MLLKHNIKMNPFNYIKHVIHNFKRQITDTMQEFDNKYIFVIVKHYYNNMHNKEN